MIPVVDLLSLYLILYPSWIPDPGAKTAQNLGSGSATLIESKMFLNLTKISLIPLKFVGRYADNWIFS
jgi:hypothetical protein